MLARARAYEPEFARAADRYGIDPRLLWCVAFNESRFVSRDSQGRSRVSPKGASGLMQFIPATAARFRINPLDDRQAIHGAAHYLRILLDRYRGDVLAALAAYNAGEGAVDAYRYGITVHRAGAPPINPARRRTRDGLPPYRETREYVRQALALWQSVDWRSRFTVAQRARTNVAGSSTEIRPAGVAIPPPTSVATLISLAPEAAQLTTEQATIKQTLFHLPSLMDFSYAPRSVSVTRANGVTEYDSEEVVEPSTAVGEPFADERTEIRVTEDKSRLLPRSLRSPP